MKNKKIFWVGAFVGGIYALIPFLGYIYWWLFSTMSEPGPAFLMVLPPFWPALLTYGIISWFFIMFFKILMIFEKNALSLQITSNLINVILWIVIGGFVGWLISRVNKNKNPGCRNL